MALVAVSLCLYPVQCVADGCRPCETHFLVSKLFRRPTARQGMRLPETNTPSRPPGSPSALLDTTLYLPRQPIKPRLPPRAAWRQTPTYPMVLPRWAASRVVSAASPACGHRSSVYGKPPKSAGQSISRPTPLAP